MPALEKLGDKKPNDYNAKCERCYNRYKVPPGCREVNTGLYLGKSGRLHRGDDKRLP